jgi:hypothetical protein
MSTIVHLPLWCADIVANPPRSGEGFHSWMFRAARALWKCGRTENDIRAVLENVAATCGRQVSAREIEDALRNSHTSAVQSAGLRGQRWPSVNAEQREAIIATGFGLVDLWEFSPIRFENNTSHTEQIIDALFPGNLLLCCAATKDSARTARRDEWRGRMRELQLIVPNPMTAPTGLNQSGEVSHRCLGNTGARRFLVVEQDSGTVDEQSAILLHLAHRAPLALAVHSGSKSIHGWFYCSGTPEEKLRRFMSDAVSLGADRATWTRCQLVRMPDGKRENGKQQTTYFFNPGVIR